MVASLLQKREACVPAYLKMQSERSRDSRVDRSGVHVRIGGKTELAASSMLWEGQATDRILHSGQSTDRILHSGQSTTDLKITG